MHPDHRTKKVPPRTRAGKAVTLGFEQVLAKLQAENAQFKWQLEQEQNYRQPPASTSSFPAEVEAMRPEFEQLAAALIKIVKLQTGDPKEMQEGTGLGASIKNELATTLEAHLVDLWQSLDWFDPRTIERFYVEMRLHAEEVKRRVARDYEQATTEPPTRKEAR